MYEKETRVRMKFADFFYPSDSRIFSFILPDSINQQRPSFYFRIKLFVYCYLLLSPYSLDKRKGGKYWDKEINVFPMKMRFSFLIGSISRFPNFSEKAGNFTCPRDSHSPYFCCIISFSLFPPNPIFLIVFSEGRRLLISKIRTVNDQFPIFDRFSTTVPILLDFPWKNFRFGNIFSKKSQDLF